MSKLITILFHSSLLIFFVSCAASKNQDETKTITTVRETKEQYPEAQLGEIVERTDAFKINSAVVKGNFIHFEVSYSGGCEQHDFKLVGEKTVSSDNPPKRAIQLQHVAHNDRCKAIINEKLIYSISILSDHYKQGKVVSLILQNNGQKLDYIFQ